MRRLTPFLLALLALPAGAADQPKTPRIANLEKVNTSDDEDEPHIASGGTALYYSRSTKGKWSLQVATRQDVDGYSAETADSAGSFLPPDGKYPQYLSSASNKTPEKRDGGGDTLALYVPGRQRAGAASPEPTPGQAVCTGVGSVNAA